MTDLNNSPKIDGVYYGKRAAMHAEISVPTFYEGRYLVQIVGDGAWDAEGCSSLKQARECAKYLAAHYGVSVTHVV